MENKLCIIQKPGATRIYLNNAELNGVVDFELKKSEFSHQTVFTVSLIVHEAQVNPGEPCFG